jgi:hypothetical protein
MSNGSDCYGGFVALIVSGPNAVAQFETAYPNHFSRCHLAQLLSRGRKFTAPYSVRLEEHSDWRVGSEFESFIGKVIPETMRAHLAVYNVSDWDHYNYSDRGTSMPSSTASVASEETAPLEWTEFDTVQHDSPLPKRSRALESFTTRTFDLDRSRSAHTSPLKAVSNKRPWQRLLSSQQNSPLLESVEQKQTAAANKIPRDLTLLATDTAINREA